MSRHKVLIAGTLIVLAMVAVAPIPRRTNCGGNSAALALISRITLTARVGLLDSPDGRFRFDGSQREEVGGDVRWRGGRLLVSTVPLSKDEVGRRVIVVCDEPFRNVPRQLIGSAPPTHAAGFSDGSICLISPAEFAALDFSTFAWFDDLYPPTKR
jgi:hypothetical protein